MYDRLARETDNREKSIRQQQRTEMEQDFYRTLAFTEAEPSDRPMRLTLCYIDAAQLSQAQRHACREGLGSTCSWTEPLE